MTPYSLCMRLCVCASVIISASSLSANTWTYDFLSNAGANQTGWGSNWTTNAVSLGGTGSTNFIRKANHITGPVVGADSYYTGGIQTATQGLDFATTGVSNSSYNLSTGDLNMRVAWSPWTYYVLNPNSINPASAVNELFQIGLSNGTTGTLGGGSMDAFYLSGLENSAARTQLGAPTSAGLTQAIDLSETNMNWFMATDSGANVGSVTSGTYEIQNTMATSVWGTDKSGNPELQWTNQAHHSSVYMFDITFSNANASTMDVDVQVARYEVETNSRGSGAVLSEQYMEHVGGYSLTGVSHGLSSITNLRPALGQRIEDAANVSVTGANFDAGIDVVPEPSSGVMIAFAGGLLVLRRRR